MTEEEYYARIKAEYEASTDEKLVEWARPYFEGTKEPNNKDQYIVCPVSERAALDIFIKTKGCDVSGFNHVLRCDVVRHVDKRHGKKGSADQSMSDINDLGRIAYVLNHYDRVELGKRKSRGFHDKESKHAKVIIFIMRINGHVYTSEAITDSKNKCLLHIDSAYQENTKDKSGKKKEFAITGQYDPDPNVQNEANSVTSILPQPEKNVNSLEEESFSSPDRRTEQTRIVGDERAKRAAEIAAIKAELRGKSPKEIAEMSRQKNKQNGNNPSNNDGKPSNGSGSGGSSGR